MAISRPCVTPLTGNTTEYWIINEWKNQVMVLSFTEPTAEGSKSKSRLDQAANMDDDDLVNTKIYTFDDYIEVKCIEGMAIRMDDIMSIP